MELNLLQEPLDFLSLLYQRSNLHNTDERPMMIFVFIVFVSINSIKQGHLVVPFIYSLAIKKKRKLKE